MEWLSISKTDFVSDSQCATVEKSVAVGRPADSLFPSAFSVYLAGQKRRPGDSALEFSGANCRLSICELQLYVLLENGIKGGSAEIEPR